MADDVLLWRKHPNGGRAAAVSVPLHHADRLLQRGWLKVNGRRAVIKESLGDEFGPRIRLYIVFDEPYPDPHP